MKRLFISAFLLGCTLSLTAQREVSSPQARTAYLNALYETMEPEEELIDAINAASLAEKDTAGMVHAQGWKAYIVAEHDINAAREVVQKTLALAETAGLDPSGQILAPTYLLAAYISEDTEQSIAFFRKALAAAPADSYFGFAILSSLAAELAYNCLPEAEDHFETMLSWIEQQPKKEQRRLRVMDYGEPRAYYLFNCTRNVEQAEVIYRSQYDLLRKEDDDIRTNHDLLIITANLAYINADMGRFEFAERLLAKVEAVDLYQTPLTVGYYNELVVCMYQAAMLSGDLPRARKNLEAQLEFLLKHPELSSSNTIDNAYQCLYLTCSALNDMPAAMTYLLNTRVFQKESPLGYSVAMAEILYETGKYQACTDTIRQRLREQCFDCQPGELPTVENDLLPDYQLHRLAGFAYEYLIKSIYQRSEAAPPNEKVRMLKEAVALGEKMIGFHQRDLEVESIHEEAYLSSSNTFTGAITLQAELVARLSELTQDDAYQQELFSLLESAKGNDLKKVLATNRLPGGKQAEETRLARKVRAAEVKQATATDSDKVRLREAYLEASSEYNSLWESLWTEYPDELREQYALRSVSLEQLRASMPPDAVFLHYSTADELYENMVMVQVVTKETAVFRRIKLDIELAETITEFRTLLRSPFQAQRKKRERFITLSHQLYQLLIAPVAGLIPAGNRLMICAEGELHFVPFEALISDPADRPYTELPFLLKTNPVNYHYSATTYVNSRARSSAGEGIVTFAPVFDDGKNTPLEASAYRSFPQEYLMDGVDKKGRVAPLPFTRNETEGIVNAYPDQSVTTLLGAKANREALRTALGEDRSIIHIATHGFINENNHDLSALACAGSTGKQADLLYANDIRNEEIKADLIVLSSCESGLGRQVSGEGLIALNRAFIYAGARNVISTLWKIDDRFSSEIMIDFHSKIAAGASYTEALWAAKLSFLENPVTAQPRFWAPFVLIGE